MFSSTVSCSVFVHSVLTLPSAGATLVSSVIASHRPYSIILVLILAFHSLQSSTFPLNSRIFIWSRLADMVASFRPDSCVLVGVVLSAFRNVSLRDLRSRFAMFCFNHKITAFKRVLRALFFQGNTTREVVTVCRPCVTLVVEQRGSPSPHLPTSSCLVQLVSHFTCLSSLFL